LLVELAAALLPVLVRVVAVVLEVIEQLRPL
jgi:hypothetical protein